MKKGIDSVSSRLRRWVIGLQEFMFSVEYLPGVQNISSNCLSRLVDNSKVCEDLVYESGAVVLVISEADVVRSLFPDTALVRVTCGG